MPAWRETRWIAVTDDIVAFAPAEDDDAGWARLQAEGRLIAAWRAAGLPVPRVVAEDGARRVQVRQRLSGVGGEAVPAMLFGGRAPVDRYVADVPLTDFGARLAAGYGELAARMHLALPATRASVLGVGARRSVVDLDEAFGLLAGWHAEPSTLDALSSARSWLETRLPADVVVHGDLHFHNMCVAMDGTITGVFDFGDSGIDSGWEDLQYVHSLGPRFAAIAMAAYTHERGVALNEDAVRRAHLRTALGHLRWFPPGSERHPEIMRWVHEGAVHMPPLGISSGRNRPPART